MKRVLITGATGFIGRPCAVRLAESGCEVHAVSKTSRGDLPGVTWHSVDLLEPGRAAKLVREVQPTHLLHLAWITTPGVYLKSPENLRWVEASLGLLDAFAAHGGRRAVLAGTCFEYDWTHGWLREGVTPLAPRTLYGVCKRSLQMLAEEYCKSVGVSCAWARLFYLYGPGEHPRRLVPSVIGPLLRGEPARCTAGLQARDYLHSEDAADALTALLDSNVEGPVNVASGRPTAVRDVIYHIADQVGGRDLVQLGSLPTPPDDPPLIVADVKRLKEELGWSPRYDLARGLEQTIRWWQSRAA